MKRILSRGQSVTIYYKTSSTRKRQNLASRSVYKWEAEKLMNDVDATFEHMSFEKSQQIFMSSLLNNLNRTRDEKRSGKLRVSIKYAISIKYEI